MNLCVRYTKNPQTHILFSNLCNLLCNLLCQLGTNQINNQFQFTPQKKSHQNTLLIDFFFFFFYKKQFLKSSCIMNPVSSVATTIFKIKAIADYIANDPKYLSFRKGQPFYALSVDYEAGWYYVSTQFATPFARNAVCGLVPIRHFIEIELVGRDGYSDKRTTMQHATERRRIYQSRIAAVRALDNSNSDKKMIPASEWSSIDKNHSLIYADVISVQVSDKGIESITIQAFRSLFKHQISRSLSDLTTLHKALMSLYGPAVLPHFPIKHENMSKQSVNTLPIAQYLNSLIASPWRQVKHSRLLARVCIAHE